MLSALRVAPYKAKQKKSFSGEPLYIIICFMCNSTRIFHAIVFVPHSQNGVKIKLQKRSFVCVRNPLIYFFSYTKISFSLRPYSSLSARIACVSKAPMLLFVFHISKMKWKKLCVIHFYSDALVLLQLHTTSVPLSGTTHSIESFFF